ncbi:hypothetical protein J3R30DRAFT_3375716 [Lentinula aciculospora]|uniref:Uncharacterized protein n=1 Tax=Lentinula aciculospora TaxID=153920 RepID=A0A9W9A6G8_9AGAR|nr:hypothetical protein J3R30DRAFT_3375716 [Lentinula aciculospora]
MAGELWSKKKTNIPWRAPTIGDIIGCGLARIYGDGTEKILQGESRLWKLLIAQSAHLIWALHCERVIRNEGRNFTENKIRNRWVKKVNDLLELNRNMTHRKYDKKALSKRLVLQTWKGILVNEDRLPRDWMDYWIDRVLVGTTGRDGNGGVG